MPTYSTPTSLRTFLGVDSAALPDPEATRLIELAEDRLDRIVGPGPVDVTTGRAVMLTGLAAWRLAKLAQATNTIAGLLRTNPAAFVPRDDVQSKGPDFEVVTRANVVSGRYNSGLPQETIDALRMAAGLLDAAGLRRLTARAV